MNSVVVVNPDDTVALGTNVINNETHLSVIQEHTNNEVITVVRQNPYGLYNYRHHFYLYNQKIICVYCYFVCDCFILSCRNKV